MEIAPYLTISNGGNFIVPYCHQAKLPELLAYLETENIEFKLKQANLEDAYINFTNIKQNEKPLNLKTYDDEFSKDDPIASNKFISQTSAIFLVRFYQLFRQPKQLFIILLPTIFAVLLFLLGFNTQFKIDQSTNLLENIIN